MGKKKIIWITGALATAGLVAYSFLHKCDGECLICRYPYRGMVDGTLWVGGALLGFYFDTCCLKS